MMVLQNLRLNFGHIFCIPLTVTVVLSSAVPFAYSTTAAFSHQHRLTASASPMNPSPQTASPVPPVAKKVEHAMEMFGDVRIDNYYWLRDDSRTNPEVLSYLRQENAYTDSVMSGTKEFEDKLFAEIRGRIKEDDVSAPVRKGPYYYYKRTLERKEYVQHCRRLISDSQKVPSVHDTMPTGPEAPQEHVILDENVKAQHHQYYRIGAFKVSPNNKLVAYAEDTKGDEIYTVYVIDAETQAPIGEPLVGVTAYLEWIGDDALVYITRDEILRPDKAWLHVLGTERSKDTSLYVEKDNMFFVRLQASESKKYLFVASGSKNTSFNFYLDISKPEEGLKVLTSRIDGIKTTVSHRGDHFFIMRRSDKFLNSEVVGCAVNNTSSTIVLIPHRERFWEVLMQHVMSLKDSGHVLQMEL
ncbi:Dipeptidyl aminopeptidase BI [Spatholobus suberectus]|nr:Dipeptidyl aminopeptidase BI [Spatholobus suberectus]